VKEWKRQLDRSYKKKEKCYIESRRKKISCVQYIEEKLTGLVASCVGTAL